MANSDKYEQGIRTRQKILEMIIGYIEQHGYPPCTREICDGVGLSSTSSVNSHLKRMIAGGMLETDSDIPGAPRAIRVPGYKFVKVEVE